jgi:hypothetical protein
MRNGFLFTVLIFLAACAASTPDIIQVGPWFPARPAKDVPVFSDREETLRPWGAIAIIHSAKFSAEDKSALIRQKNLARKLAADVGADGIIITEETSAGEFGSGGVQAPEIFVSALAFKYVVNVSTAAR